MGAVLVSGGEGGIVGGGGKGLIITSLTHPTTTNPPVGYIRPTLSVGYGTCRVVIGGG